MREQIELAAKFYKCQKSAKQLFGNEYDEKINWYKATLKTVMCRENLDEFEAILFVSKLDGVKDNGIAVMLFLAAVVELIEN